MHVRNPSGILIILLTREGSFKGKFSVFEVNGNDVKDQNDFGVEKVNTVENPQLNTNSEEFTYSFPSHSFTLLKGRLTY